MRHLILVACLTLAACESDDTSNADGSAGAGGAAGEGGAGGVGGAAGEGGAGGGAGEGGAGGSANGCADDVPAEFAGLTSPFEGDPAAIADGEAIFNGTCPECGGNPPINCSFCHGTTGAGDGPITANPINPPPTNFTVNLGCDGDLFHRTLTGGATGPMGSIMPAYDGVLTEDQIWKVVSYIRTLAP